MRKFKPRWGKEVDLDSNSTYKHLPKTDRDLDDLMLEKIGYAVLYMDYFPRRKDLFPHKKIKASASFIKKKKFTKREAHYFLNCGWYQRQRVYKLIKNFANNRHNKWGDARWFREQVFMFDNETENMC